jgi:hypothetical protein
MLFESCHDRMRHDGFTSFLDFPICPAPTVPVLLGSTLAVNDVREADAPGGRTLDCGDGLLRTALGMALWVVRPRVVAVAERAREFQFRLLE